MRILLISAASLAVLSAAPATAQSYNPNYSDSYGNGYARRSVPTPYQVRSMIDAAQSRGELSDDQASNLREQADDLVRLDRRAQRDEDGNVRRDLTRRTFALLRDLREARGDSGNDYAYRGRSTDYPPAYGSTPQGGYDSARRAPGDDDQPYSSAPDDSYRSTPRANDPYNRSPSSGPGHTAPENYDSYRAPSLNEDADRSTPPAGEPYGTAPTPNDDQGYDDPNGQDDSMTPSDDGIYRPRNN
ncbi:hypothetical protein [Sphingomonas asaccharolytica]|uniref:hypothetical protein n=1 Tax=Sphingomonas asaccharolytica TaxID=40681 RepID=UPI00082D9FB1|nr:hypothetical protein [Sphingomonas asaccharolytica]